MLWNNSIVLFILWCVSMSNQGMHATTLISINYVINYWLCCERAAWLMLRLTGEACRTSFLILNCIFNYGMLEYQCFLLYFKWVYLFSWYGEEGKYRYFIIINLARGRERWNFHSFNSFNLKIKNKKYFDHGGRTSHSSGWSSVV